jgi:acyl-CoA synthetase (AMP-forming)/AMP-acid ligase II
MLTSQIDRVAAGLAERGLAPGSVLALRAPNTPAWAALALGTMAAGGAVTGISPLATEREAAAQLADSGATMLTTPLDELLRSTAPVPDVAFRPGQLALLPYSSGTTGLPKGVMLTHASLTAAARQLGRGPALTPRDRFLALAPFAHVMGFVVSLAAPLAAGATVVTLPRFGLPAFLAAIERHRVTVLAVPPPVLAALARAPVVPNYDLSSLELIVSGGAPVSRELQEQAAARFPGATVGQGYGLTETTATITVPDRGGTVAGSVGRLAASTQLRLVDPATGHGVGPGERGELWARGPQVMAGYLGNPAATAEVLDAGGWLRTGDLGYADAGGNVFIVDRLKELIKVNAFQVAPAELEALLAGHPRVADAAVIGTPDERTGEAPVAVVVPRGPLDPGELMAWVAQRVAPHKRIRAVRLASEIPRTPAGKILRRVLAGPAGPGLTGRCACW